MMIDLYTKIKVGWIQTGGWGAAAVEDSLVETRARHSDGSFPPYTVKRKKVEKLSIIFMKSGLDGEHLGIKNSCI